MKKNLLLSLLMLSFAWVNAQTTILEEKFEGGALPAGWQNVSKAVDGGWLFGKIATLKSSAMGYTGNTTTFATSNDDKGDQDKLEDLLITPAVDLTGKTKVFLSLNVYFGGRTDSGIKENAYILASKDNGTTWKTVAEIQPSLNDAKTALIWQTQAFDVSSYNTEKAVMFAVKFTDNGGYLYGIGVDDIKIFEPAAVDASFKLTKPKKYALKTTPVEVKALITNNGANPITEVEMSYKVGATTETKKITGLNIATFETAEVTHPTVYNYGATGPFTFNVSMDKVNSVVITGVDSFKTVVISKNVDKKVVFEEATGTWCGWCPRGAVFMDSMAQEYKKDFIGIAVHNGTNDPMKVVVYDAGLTKTPGFTGFPGVVVDRTDVIDPSEMFDFYDAARSELNPFELSNTFTYDAATRVVKVTLKTKATMTTKGDYRFNLVFTEDGVKGTAAGYNQTNYYSSTQANQDLIFGNVNWKDLPATVPAKDMVYNHVGRAILGTYAGQAGSIPASVVEGTEYTYNFTYTIPATMKPENMHIVGMVLDAQTGAIMNGVSDDVIKKPGVGTKDIFTNDAVNVYPNPMTTDATIEVTTVSNVDVSLKLYNAMGQAVAAREYGKMVGTNNLPFNTVELPNGIYTLHVMMGDKLATKKVTIQK